MMDGVQYGDGFLSPGGAEEPGRILRGLDLEGRDVLEPVLAHRPDAN